jgi:hypothetical protein
VRSRRRSGDTDLRPADRPWRGTVGGRTFRFGRHRRGIISTDRCRDVYISSPLLVARSTVRHAGRRVDRLKLLYDEIRSTGRSFFVVYRSQSICGVVLLLPSCDCKAELNPSAAAAAAAARTLRGCCTATDADGQFSSSSFSAAKSRSTFAATAIGGKYGVGLLFRRRVTQKSRCRIVDVDSLFLPVSIRGFIGQSNRCIESLRYVIQRCHTASYQEHLIKCRTEFLHPPERTAPDAAAAAAVADG